MSVPIAAHIAPDVLLADRDTLRRRTVVQVARELGLARIHDTPDVHAAVCEMDTQPFTALVIALDSEGDAFDLVTLLRCGQYPSAASTPVALLIGHGQDADATRLASLGVRETLHGACSARGVLDLIGRLVQAGGG